MIFKGASTGSTKRIGVILAVALLLFFAGTTTSSAFGPLVVPQHASFFDRVIAQVRGVASFTAEAIGAVLSFNAQSYVAGASTTPVAPKAELPTQSVASLIAPSLSALSNQEAKTLLVNVPLSLNGRFASNDVTDLSTTTVHRLFIATGRADLGSLAVHGNSALQGLSVAGSLGAASLSVTGGTSLATLAVAGSANISGILSAQGGIQTNGRDINAGTGKVYASNIINSIKAGSSIRITGTASDPIISADVPGFSTPSLASVRKVGGCDSCILDSDTSPSLTIIGGSVDATPIGLTTATSAAFADVRIGSTSTTSVLSVYGTVDLLGSLYVTSTATSTISGGLNVVNGCVSVNGVCLGGGVNVLNDLADVVVSSPSKGNILLYDGSTWSNVATSSLGINTNFSYLDLTDTPSSYIANALPFVNASGTALTQSSQLVFDGTHFGIGTSTPANTLSVSGSFRLTGALYDSTNDPGLSGYLLQSTASGQRWVSTSTLGLSFSYLDLTDTPSSYIASALPFVNASGTALTQSATLLSDGAHLSIGTSSLLRTLSVAGDMRLTGALYDSNDSSGVNGYVLQSTASGQRWVATSSLGINSPWGVSGTKIYYTSGNVGIGTSSPSEALSIAGGNIGLMGQQSLRFYAPNNAHYVGLKATSTLAANVTWTLPAADGISNEILVTDGSGHLRFANVGSVGGGSATYLGLSDTPSSFTAKAIPYTNASGTALTQSGTFVYDGSRLGIGTNAPTSTLTVQGSALIEADSTHVGIAYNSLSNKVGIGTANPTQLLTLEGGSFQQKGARSGSTYVPTQLSSIDMPDNADDVAVAGNFAYVTTAGTGNDFHIIDITNPAAPVEVGSLNLSDGANAVFVSGRYAYVVTNLTGNDFHIIDISNPSVPVEVGGLNLVTTASDVYVQGQYAYVTTTGTGNDVHVIDVSRPSSPIEVGSMNLQNGATGIAVSGKYAYVSTNATGKAFYVIDISNPTALATSSTLDLSAPANDVALQGRYAYVVTTGTGNDLHVINVMNPASISEVGSVNLSSNSFKVAVAGRYAYVVTTGTGDDFHVVDVSTPSAPIETGSTELASGAGLGVAVAGNKAYVTTSSIGDDFHIMDITGLDVQSAYADSLKAGAFASVGDAQIGGNLFVTRGLRTGIAGIETDGSLIAEGTTSASSIRYRLGIGTSSPAQALTVSGSMQLTGALYDTSNNAGLSGYILQSTAVGQRWVATSTLGLTSPWSRLGSNLYYTSGSASIGTSSSGAFLTLQGDNSATNFRVLDTRGTARFSIGNSYALTLGEAYGLNTRLPSASSSNAYINALGGNLGIGTSSPALFKLQVAGTIGPDTSNTYNLGSSGHNWGCLYYNSGTLGTCASDQRLKTNISDLSFDTAEASALEQLTALHLRTFAYRTATSSLYHGLIAQEVQKYSPELVSIDASTSLYAVQYGDIQWLTVEAVQELTKELGDMLLNGSSTPSSSFATLIASNPDSIWSRLTVLARNFADGVLTVVGIHSEEVTTNKLCVGATCLTEDQFKTLLQKTQTQDGSTGIPVQSNNATPTAIVETATSTNIGQASSTENINMTSTSTPVSDTEMGSSTEDLNSQALQDSVDDGSSSTVQASTEGG